MEQESQPCPLVLAERDGTLADKAATLFEELGRKSGTIKRCGAGHDAHPFA